MYGKQTSVNAKMEGDVAYYSVQQIAELLGGGAWWDNSAKVFYARTRDLFAIDESPYYTAVAAFTDNTKGYYTNGAADWADYKKMTFTPVKSAIIYTRDGKGNLTDVWIPMNTLSGVFSFKAAYSNVKGVNTWTLTDAPFVREFTAVGKETYKRVPVTEKPVNVTFNGKTLNVRPAVRENGAKYYPVYAILKFIGIGYDRDSWDKNHDFDWEANAWADVVEAHNQWFFTRIVAWKNGVAILSGGNDFYIDIEPFLRSLGFDVTFTENKGTMTLSVKLSDEMRSVTVVDTNEKQQTEHFASINKSHYGEIAKSRVFVNINGGVSALDVTDDGLYVTTYDANYQQLSSSKISAELPIFGGFYSGVQYNYIVFGQKNEEESQYKEVVRIVKYDKNFNRLSGLSVTNDLIIATGDKGIQIPFDFSNGCEMAEMGNSLVISMSKVQLKTGDGLNHQTSLQIFADTSGFGISLTKIGNDNYVSHSFYEGVVFDGSTPVFLNLGDSYPRSLRLGRPDGGGKYDFVTLHDIQQTKTYQFTGVNVGGFEMSATSYLAVAAVSGNYETSEDEQRNIVLFSVPRGQFGNYAVQKNVLAKYIGTDRNASAPMLVKVSDNLLVVLWEEFSAGGVPSLKYVRVDADGNTLGAVVTTSAYRLSDCKPIAFNGKVVWYVNFDGKKAFFELSF
ncbi:MAG: hypothetical protein LBU36_03745 [Clostridiales bacterium]|jgi:hypothetical protein|nr:hypothetical protein [Clostridiales bacterium]